MKHVIPNGDMRFRGVKTCVKNVESISTLLSWSDSGRGYKGHWLKQ